MSTTPMSAIVDLLEQHETELLEEWLREQERATSRRASLISSEELASDARTFLGLLRETLRGTASDNPHDPAWSRIDDYLDRLSRSRAEAGFSPAETATFVFSLKQPLFALLTEELSGASEALTAAIWETTVLLDRLGLQTTESYQAAREAVIARQQTELMELSTPVV